MEDMKREYLRNEEQLHVLQKQNIQLHRTRRLLLRRPLGIGDRKCLESLDGLHGRGGAATADLANAARRDVR